MNAKFKVIDRDGYTVCEMTASGNAKQRRSKRRKYQAAGKRLG